MCGKVASTDPWEVVHDRYRAFLDYRIEKDIEKGDPEDEEWDGNVDWAGNINIVPTTQIPILRHVGRQARVDLARWGLVPSWSKEIGRWATFNARSEELAAKPTFRGAWKAGRRCAIPANAYYEPKKVGVSPSDPKQTFAFGLGNGGPLSFAGLWEVWKPKDGPSLLSCTILTCEPNSLAAPIHDRMPVILNEDDVAKWIGQAPATNNEIAALMRPFDSSRMRAWRVTQDVWKRGYREPNMLDEIAV